MKKARILASAKAVLSHVLICIRQSVSRKKKNGTSHDRSFTDAELQQHKDLVNKRTQARPSLFKNASARGANLAQMDWSNEDFSGCDLRGADLSDCKLDGASLQNADLWNANLRHSDLTGVRRLLPAQLAAADLLGAKLPDDLKDFKGLETVEAVSSSSSKVFFTLLLTTAFVIITVATLRDVQFLTENQPPKLPVVEVPLNTIFFLEASPLLLLAFYIYFHLYLQRMWEAIAQLPARFPDGRRLDERTPPWLMNDLIRVHVPYLRSNSPPLSNLQSFLSISLGYALVPLAICIIWHRSVRAHDWHLTGVHIILAGISIACAFHFNNLIHTTLLRTNPHTPWLSRLARAFGRGIGLPVGMFSMLGLAFLSLGVFEMELSDDSPEKKALSRAETDARLENDIWNRMNKDERYVRARSASRWIPETVIGSASTAAAYFFRKEQCRFNVQAEDVSTRPAGWTGTQKKQDEELGQVKRCQLDGDLRRMNAASSFLVNALVWRTDIRWADFTWADLREATLSRTTADGAIFSYTRMEREIKEPLIGEKKKLISNLHTTNIIGGSFQKCDFNHLAGNQLFAWNVDFSEADFSEAALVNSNLSGCAFKDAHIVRADLSHAILANADFTRANLLGTKLVDSDLTEAHFDRAALAYADLTDAVLTRASLTNVLLHNAGLKGANLRDAQLRGANFSNADLSNADFTDAYFDVKSIEGADLENADLRTVRLPPPRLIELLRTARTIYNTKVPDEVQKVLAKELATKPPD